MNSPETGRGRSEVLRAVFLRIGVFWYLILCHWVCGSRRFLDIRYQSKRREHSPNGTSSYRRRLSCIPSLHIVVRRAADIGHVRRQVTLSWERIDI
jgi:hypothetical protein